MSGYIFSGIAKPERNVFPGQLSPSNQISLFQVITLSQYSSYAYFINVMHSGIPNCNWLSQFYFINNWTCNITICDSASWLYVYNMMSYIQSSSCEYEFQTGLSYVYDSQYALTIVYLLAKITACMHACIDLILYI